MTRYSSVYVRLSKPVTYRHSSLKAFLKCPASYRYEYMDGIERGHEGIEAFNGSRVHTAVEIAHTAIKHDSLPSLAQVRKWYREDFDQHYDPAYIRINSDGKALGDYLALGDQSVVNWYTRYFPFTEVKVLAAEKALKLKLGPHSLTGIIDRYGVRERTGAINIWDLKTGASPLSQLEADQDLQLAIYEMAIRQETGYTGEIELNWYYSRDDREIVSRRSPEQLEEAKDRVLSIIDQIEEATEINHFPARLSHMCAWCSFCDICPTYQEDKELRSA